MAGTNLVPADFDAVAYINQPRWQASRLGLERIRKLLDMLGRPQEALRVVHVAGTNGKGSTCAYLESVLRAAGYRTGLFTSPYIERFEERIQVGGRPIEPENLRRVTWRVREAAEALTARTGDHPTEFELMTSVAFLHFAEAGCDIVVAEVGLGGRLDSTNVIEGPEVCVITRVALDHTALLGETLGAIAAEKAAIIKPGATVVSWPQEPEAMVPVAQAAHRAGDEICVPDFSRLHVEALEVAPLARLVHPRSPVVPLQRFSFGETAYATRLLGSYQPANAALALTAVEALRSRGWHISTQAAQEGIAHTEWPGRFEVLPWKAGETPVVLDGGHNEQGAQALARSLARAFPGRRVVLIMSVLADKDWRAMVQAVLPAAKAVICVTPPSPRALSAQELADYVHGAVEKASEEGGASVSGKVSGPVVVAAATDFSDADRIARTLATPQDVICAFGSLYSVADARRALARP